jgi:hypothetical protein
MVMTSSKQKAMGALFEGTVPFYENCLGFGRYFGEAWIGSGVRLNGADCVHEKWSNYLFGYEIPWPLIVQCMELRAEQVAGSCGPARANSSLTINNFKSIFSTREFISFIGCQDWLLYLRLWVPFCMCRAVLATKQCANIEMMTKRSYLWYKEFPTALVDWRTRLGEPDTSGKVDRNSYLHY